MADDLHMVQIHFDGRELIRAEKRHRLVRAPDDDGYLMHAHLAACFGDLAPKPFSIRRKSESLEVLGYGSAGAEELKQTAADFAEPDPNESWTSLKSKTMRTEWDAGRRLGFEVRVCPVVRLSSDREIPLRARKEDETTGLHLFRKGSEVDVFQRDLGEEGLDAGVTRARSYGRWLQEAFADAATLEGFDLIHFQLSKLYRRTQGSKRKGRTMKRPDATFRGNLAVGDPEVFAELLERGVGRHRAFGFGMLLLRPPG